MASSAAQRFIAWVRRHRSGTAAVVILLVGSLLITLDLGGTWGFVLLGRLDPVWGFATLLPGCLVVALKHRAPMTALAVGSAIFLVDFALIGSIALLAVLNEVIYEATVSLGRRGRERMLAILVAVGIVLLVGIAVLTRDVRTVVFAAIIAFAIIGTPFWWGTAVRSAEEVAELHAARAEDAARMVAMRERDAVLDERRRMAGDLHDAIAGHLSAVALRSEAALARPADERQDREALGAVREASLRSLDELRSMVLLLRSGAEPIAAADRLDRLDAIIAEARDAGLTVTADLALPPSPPTAVDQAAARIVRESLRNAAKHAAGGTVDVRVAADSAELELEVRSASGAGSKEAPSTAGVGGAGVGLAMLRERAEALGGTFSAGHDGGHWVVRARLPLGVRP
jgi:signal transduction histidine kinase